MSPEHEAHTAPEIQELNGLIESGERNPNDAAWQGRTLLFMARRVRFMMERDTMTVAACNALRANCQGARLFKDPKGTLTAEAMRYGFGSLGWVALVAYLYLTK